MRQAQRKFEKEWRSFEHDPVWRIWWRIWPRTRRSEGKQVFRSFLQVNVYRTPRGLVSRPE
jgi:hypothetical protein